MQKEVFLKNRDCLVKIPKIVYFFKKQMFFEGSKLARDLIKELNDISNYIMVSAMSEEEKQQWLLILQAFLNAQENKDYILMADILERDMLAFLEKLQEAMILSDDIVIDGYWDANMESLQIANPSLYQVILRDSEDITKQSTGIQYEPMFAMNGQPTLKVHFEGKTFCMHSTVNPEWEGNEIAKLWLETKNSEYGVFGIGMGYHIKALLELDENINVTVLEYRIEPLVLALHYMDFAQYIVDGRLSIVYEADLLNVLQHIKAEKNGMVFFLHYPSLQCVEQQKFKEILEDYFINVSSMLEQGKSLELNFEYLQKQNYPSCDILRGIFEQKDVAIIAGGPSLDDEMESLKKYREKLTILAVGTVARKLLHAGIRPDAIIITDPQGGMYRQIEGVETGDIPLLLLSTASKSVVKYYQGPIHLVYQHGYEPAEKVANEYGYSLFQTGGSVTTTALDVSLEFGAKKIFLIGADMGYTDNRSHAGGIGHEANDTSDFRQVPAVDGGIVYTTRNLDIYRKWIERRIASIEQPIVYNTSRGAKITGTVEAKLKDVIGNY